MTFERFKAMREADEDAGYRRNDSEASSSIFQEKQSLRQDYGVSTGRARIQSQVGLQTAQSLSELQNRNNRS